MGLNKEGFLDSGLVCLKVEEIFFFEVDGLHFGYFDGNLMVDGHHSFYR